ncbi:response regulator transcription factor [Erysipelothrix inopinata]|uniref:Response regulator transcription factor n=1 Tax=Erysipelothrix inopinata TaxID=225084 RepID=A0A7G9RXX3_9FIRM|nr:response regulator transcription factor [Erysipelothrix inopinata]QNN60448.1 response regulator transcription factor [Erysipelothrix inopinata]
MKKILIIEDEEGIRRLLRYDLRQMNFEVDSAKDGKEGMSLALANSYDVIIVDWMLPFYSGIELVETFREKKIDSILIMLTAKDEETDILEAFEAGVDDYLTKPFSPRELSARINAHLRRAKSPNSEHTIEVEDVIVQLDKHRVTIDNEEIELTKKEFDLLVYLLQNVDIVLSRDQILSEIWNFDYDGDTRIVDVHVFKLRNKLENSNVKISSLRGVGYVAKRK